METQQFRIGNIIEQGVISMVSNTSVWIECKEQTPILKDEISGVKLSEEWLDRLGFVYNYFDGYRSSLTIEEYNYSVNFDIQHKDFSTNMKLGYKLEFVHQIQNLFFTIKGEELKISKTK